MRKSQEEIREQELRKDIRRLLGERLAVLSTHDEGRPYASLVAFAATEDLRHIVFATSRPTRKYANLRADARVALLVDSRRNEEADFHRAEAVTAIGVVAEITGPEREKYLPLYLAKHPALEDFVRAATCALLCVSVERYLRVKNFQRVSELRIRT